MLHTFVALVEDTPGALTRVASLFRRLNINIISLTVGHSERRHVFGERRCHYLAHDAAARASSTNLAIQPDWAIRSKTPFCMMGAA